MQGDDPRRPFARLRIGGEPAHGASCELDRVTKLSRFVVEGDREHPGGEEERMLLGELLDVDIFVVEPSV